jgi:hypothetical protein
MFWHQDAKERHWSALGKPASSRQAVNWTAQEPAAVKHEFLSVNVGIGFEHQLPHLYSHVGVGTMLVVEVQREALVFVVDGEVVVGFDVVDLDVGEVVGYVTDEELLVLEIVELTLVELVLEIGEE